MTKETIQPLTPKERAEILYNKYSREYNRIVCSGKMQQTEHWREVTKELAKLYNKEVCEYCNQDNGKHKISCPTLKIQVNI